MGCVFSAVWEASDCDLGSVDDHTPDKEEIESVKENGTCWEKDVCDEEDCGYRVDAGHGMNKMVSEDACVE